MVTPVQRSKTAPIGLKPAVPASAPSQPTTAATASLGQDASSVAAPEAAEAADALDIEAIDLSGAPPKRQGAAATAGAQPGKGKGHGGEAAKPEKNSVEVGYTTKDGLKTGVTVHATDNVSLLAHTSNKNGKTHADATVRYKDETLDANLGYDTEKGVNGGLSVKATDQITLTVHASESEGAREKGEKSEKSEKPQAAKPAAKSTTGKATTAKATTAKARVPEAPSGPHVDAAIDYKDDKTTARLAYDSQKGVSGLVSRQLDDRWKVTATASVKDGQTDVGGKVGYKDKTTNAELGYSTKDGVSGKVGYKATEQLNLEVDGSYNRGKTKVNAKGTYKTDDTTVELGYGTAKGLNGSVMQKLDERFSVGAVLADSQKLSAVVKYRQQNIVVTTQVGSVNKFEVAYKKDNLEAGAFVSHDRDHGTAAGVSMKLSF